MQYRKLGTTDMSISVVSMGCWSIVPDFTWGEQAEADSVEAVRAAVRLGVNFLDTAPLYGEDGASETMLGKALGDWRDSVYIATKIPPDQMRPDEVIAACEASLTRLNTDRIDLYQIHWPSRDVPLADTLGAMEKLKEQGKIRAIGVCNFGPGDMDELNATGVRVESNQIAYSLLARGPEFGILGKCIDYRMSAIAYSPLAQGLLTGKFSSADEVPATRARTRHFASSREHTRHGEPGCESETFAAIAKLRAICERIEKPMADVALAWLLRQLGVISALAGARNAEQAKQNAEVGSFVLTPGIADELSAATEPVKEALGENPDLWQPASESRMR